ncbi:hypothetical protein LT493_10130 [Streptomyces tricolor]|nr:hypothetical protein [Streptomyces tricolor]
MLGVEQGVRVEDDRVVVGADVGAGLDGVRGVVAGAQHVPGEPLGLVAVVDGVRADAGVGGLRGGGVRRRAGRSGTVESMPPDSRLHSGTSASS